MGQGRVSKFYKFRCREVCALLVGALCESRPHDRRRAACAVRLVTFGASYQSRRRQSLGLDSSVLGTVRAADWRGREKPSCIRSVHRPPLLRTPCHCSQSLTRWYHQSLCNIWYHESEAAAEVLLRTAPLCHASQRQMRASPPRQSESRRRKQDVCLDASAVAALQLLNCCPGV